MNVIKNEKTVENLMCAVESMCKCSNTLIVARRQGIEPSSPVAEEIADVRLRLEQLSEELGLVDDVSWWLAKKEGRHGERESG